MEYSCQGGYHNTSFGCNDGYESSFSYRRQSYFPFDQRDSTGGFNCRVNTYRTDCSNSRSHTTYTIIKCRNTPNPSPLKPLRPINHKTLTFQTKRPPRLIRPR